MATGDAPQDGGVRWLDDREQATWRAFLAAQTRLMSQLGREMQDASGLSGADFAVLVQLSEHPGGRMRVLELARTLEWEKSRLSHQLTRMGKRGLIERAHCQVDRRGAFVTISDEGRAVVELAAPRHVEAVRRYVFDDLTSEQVGQLAAICTAITARVDAARQADGTCPAASEGCS